MQKRPFITLFALISIDGKLSFGHSNNFQGRNDLFYATSIQIGMYQFEEISKTVDDWNLTTAYALVNSGLNNQRTPLPKLTKQHSLVILDFDNLLTDNLLKYTSALYKSVVIFTSNTIQQLTIPVNIVVYENINWDLNEILVILANKLNVNHLTIQGDGKLNADFIRGHLVDRLSLVQAPIIIGGRDTPSMVAGQNIISLDDLSLTVPMQLESINILKHSFLQLNYRTIN